MYWAEQHSDLSVLSLTKKCKKYSLCCPGLFISTRLSLLINITLCAFLTSVFSLIELLLYFMFSVSLSMSDKQCCFEKTISLITTKLRNHFLTWLFLFVFNNRSVSFLNFSRIKVQCTLIKVLVQIKLPNRYSMRIRVTNSNKVLKNRTFIQTIVKKLFF